MMFNELDIDLNSND